MDFSHILFNDQASVLPVLLILELLFHTYRRFPSNISLEQFVQGRLINTNDPDMFDWLRGWKQAAVQMQ